MSFQAYLDAVNRHVGSSGSHADESATLRLDGRAAWRQEK